jgi:orotidine-5'-phosphate decarboxylase
VVSTDRSFNQRLSQTCDVRGHVCVGLDPDPDEYLKLTSLSGWRPGIADYCKFVIEATNGVAAAFKVNSAFFERHGPDGMAQLQPTLESCRAQPGAPIVLLDAKRGDIGNSSAAYAAAAFECYAIGACIFVDDLAASEVEASFAELRALHAEFDS